MSLLKRYGLESAGNIAMTFALTCSTICVMVVGGVELAMMSGGKQRLQEIADSSALAAARQMALAMDDQSSVANVAESYAASMLGNANSATITAFANLDTASVTVQITKQNNSATGILGGTFERELSVTSTARLSGERGNLCLVSLNPVESRTLLMSTSARLTARDCMVYANSISTDAFAIKNKARMKVSAVCVGGGMTGDENRVSGAVVLDCPTVDDPLEARVGPILSTQERGEGEDDFHSTQFGGYTSVSYRYSTSHSGCDENNMAVRARQRVKLEPGTYCGGLSVRGGTAELEPGVYTIKDGPLSVSGGGTLTGEDVGFFLTGRKSNLHFGVKSTVELEAPREGVMAGLLFFEDPMASAQGAHRITSDDARRLVGTIYLPKGKLLIDGTKPVADESEYTIVVADSFELRNGPNLVLNANYSKSDVPVPEGVGFIRNPQISIIE